VNGIGLEGTVNDLQSLDIFAVFLPPSRCVQQNQVGVRVPSQYACEIFHLENDLNGDTKYFGVSTKLIHRGDSVGVAGEEQNVFVLPKGLYGRQLRYGRRFSHPCGTKQHNLSASKHVGRFRYTTHLRF